MCGQSEMTGDTPVMRLTLTLSAGGTISAIGPSEACNEAEHAITNFSYISSMFSLFFPPSCIQLYSTLRMAAWCAFGGG